VITSNEFATLAIRRVIFHDIPRSKQLPLKTPHVAVATLPGKNVPLLQDDDDERPLAGLLEIVRRLDSGSGRTFLVQN